MNNSQNDVKSYDAVKSVLRNELFQTNIISDQQFTNEHEDKPINASITNQSFQSLKTNTSLRTSIHNNAFAELLSNYVELMNTDLKEFVFKPAPKGTTFKCVINRDKQGIDGGIHPAFYMYYEREDKKKVKIEAIILYFQKLIFLPIQ